MDSSRDQHVSADVFLPETVVADDLLTIDVSGADGADGRDGRSYAGSRAPRGRHGRSGEDATRAQSGQDAGEIELVLQPVGTDEQLVQLVGRKGMPRGGEVAVRESVTIGDVGAIRLLARGGRGGDGGRGGEGEAGGKGHDGADATRWSSGDNGGPGGDGGDGAAGTSGADGGRGGRIAVHVDQRDTHLLMLVKQEVNGGEGGKPGANGRGGEGGPGGEGGRSHTWTTTSTEYVTNAQGQRQPRTVTHHHRNRGGFDGRPGRRGRDAQAVLRRGTNASHGDFRILVRREQEIIEYLQRYEVELVNYEVELADQFAEPTSEIRVSQTTVRNVGGMPTPDRCPVVIALAPSSWVQPHRHVLKLPHALEPGESYTFHDGVLLAEVSDIDAVPVGDPLREQDRISPLVRQSGVNRYFNNLHSRHKFTVAFPCELAAVQSLESQTPGRAARFVVGLVNRSRLALGQESATKRFLGIRVELVNQEMAGHVMMLDLHGNQVPWDAGYQEEIRHLPAGETWTDQLIFGILPGAPGYRKVELAVTLQLGRLDAPHEPRDRHCLVYPVRIAQAYEYDPTADLLLIANHSTTTEELAAWHAAAAALGQTMSVWDISLNDSLSLSQKLAHGQSLLRDFHGKTIVLMNAPFRTSLGTRYGDQFLSQMDLIKAAESHGIRVLVVNDEQHELAHLFKERLIPTDGEPEYRYDSIKAFTKAEPLDDVDVLFEQVDELIKHGTQAARPDPIRQTSEIDLYGIRSADDRRLRKQAVKLQKQLQDDMPGRRVVVMYQLPADLPDDEKRERENEEPRGGFFFTHEYQGTLTVMPTLGDDHPNLVVLHGPPERLHDPDYIASPYVTAALIQALNFEEKVYLLSERMSELGEAWRIDPEAVRDPDIRVAQFLVDAILVDLATEQAAILKTQWKGLFSGGTVRDALTHLKLLAEHRFPLITGGVEQPDFQLAARLLAGIEFLGRTSSRWYEARIFPWGFFRRGPVLRAAILAHQKTLEKNLLRQPKAAQSQVIAELVRQHYIDMKQKKRAAKTDSRTAARLTLVDPLSRYGIQTDAGKTFPSVLAYNEWTTIREAESQREADRVELREIKEQNRAAYAVARSGQPLPGIEPTLARALQPFVAACAAAESQRRQRVEEAAQQKAERRGTAIETGAYHEPAATQETLDRHTPPMQEEA